MATVTETFTSSGTWTCYTGITSVDVVVRAGGGAGGISPSANGGGGGGGGGYSKKIGISVTPTTAYTVTVGTGGAGVIDADGNPGGDSWFLDDTTVLAKGGNGGTAANGGIGIGGTGGQATNGIGDTKWNGGDGGDGYSGDDNGGGGGEGGNSDSNGADGQDGQQYTGGVGGSSGDGGDGGDGLSAAGNGFPGETPGGGGGAGSDYYAGGAGASGEVTISYEANAPTYVSTGTEGSANATSVTPGLPAGIAENDILVMVAHLSDDSTLSVNTAEDWTEIVDADGGNTTSRLGIWWHRYDGVNAPDRQINNDDAVTEQWEAAIMAFRGCETSGSPFDVVGTSAGNIDASIEHTAITSLVDWTLLLVCNGSADDNNRTALSGYNVLINESTFNCYKGTAGTPDGSVATFMKYLPDASTDTGTITVTQAAADPWASVLVSLKAPAVGGDQTITPSTLNLTASLQTPTVTYDYKFTPEGLALTATILDPTVDIVAGGVDYTFVADALAIVLAQLSPTVKYDYRVALSPLALTPALPTISYRQDWIKIQTPLSLRMASANWTDNISNADIDDEDMADISDWSDLDSGTGESTQVTFDSKSCMKLDSGGTAGSSNYARRQQDIGSFGDRTVFSIRIYCDAIGTIANGDNFYFMPYDGSTGLWVKFASDGLFIYDGATYNEVGTDLVVQDTWQEWTFDVDWVAQTVDVYLNQELQASDVDCSWASGTLEGTTVFYQYGTTTINQITYIDWFKAGSDFANLLPISHRVDYTETQTPLNLTSSLQAPTITYSCKLTPDGLSLTAAILNPTITSAYTFLASPIALVLAQLSPTVKYDYKISPSVLSLTAVLPTATFKYDYKNILSALGLTSTLLDSAVIRSLTISPSIFSLIGGIGTPSNYFDYQFIPTLQSLTAGQGTPTISSGQQITPAIFSLAAALGDITLNYDYVFSVAPQSLSAALGIPDIKIDFVLSPTPLGLTLAQLAPTASTVIIIHLSTLNLTVAVLDPNLVFDRLVTVESLGLFLAQYEPTYILINPIPPGTWFKLTTGASTWSKLTTVENDNWQKRTASEKTWSKDTLTESTWQKDTKVEKVWSK